MNKAILYHWTPRRNWQSITRDGILTACARSTPKHVYACSEDYLMLWLHCVSRNHCEHADHFVLFAIDAEWTDFYQLSTSGTYFTDVDVKPEYLCGMLDRIVKPWTMFNRYANHRAPVD